MHNGTPKGGKAKGLTGEWSRKGRKANERRMRARRARATNAELRNARGSNREAARGVGSLDWDPTEE